ncbi:olfactory receptor 6F1-like [Sceloporus undulatus]|uniref:olfactory receptor 6F1-like n=1 Tax=Sceloporus undulatus TaxID=8520 RepID=UPI001C4B0DA0|nr:olfactory receptor 6F1-like [Sceloporus undulatus]
MMENIECGNETTITEFILLGFGNVPRLQTPFFLLFLFVYIMTVAGNLTILSLIVTDRHLQTPMYFFLANLSCLETCYSSTILPRMLASVFSRNNRVTFDGCLIQLYCFSYLATAECYLLAVMAYDRYLAICKPLHYVTSMNIRTTIQLAAGAWLSPVIVLAVIVALLSGLHFCGPNEIDHFFCDLSPVIHLSCTDIKWVTLTIFIMASIDTFPPFLLTLTSYVFIITTIMRIPSTKGRQKAFSTCSSHLTVVTIFYGTLIMVYVLLKTDTLRELNKIFSVFYTVLTPLANPIIYSLRNKEVKESLKRCLRRKSIVFIRV